MDYFKLLCWIFCVWDALILVLLAAILYVAVGASKRVKAMDERHAQELFLQTKMYKCLLRCTVIMEQNWLEKKE